MSQMMSEYLDSSRQLSASASVNAEVTLYPAFCNVNVIPRFRLLSSSSSNVSFPVSDKSAALSNHSLDQYFIAQRYLFHPDLLLFIKIKAYHISMFQMIGIQIIRKLFFASLVIFSSPPYF